jgi:hypothetical protein
MYYYFTVYLYPARSTMNQHSTSAGHPEFVSLWVTLTPPRFHPFTLPLIFRSDYYVRN